MVLGAGQPPQRPVVKCYNCGRPGHYSRNCRSPRKRQYQQRDDNTNNRDKGKTYPTKYENQTKGPRNPEMESKVPAGPPAPKEPVPQIKKPYGDTQKGTAGAGRGRVFSMETMTAFEPFEESDSPVKTEWWGTDGRRYGAGVLLNNRVNIYTVNHHLSSNIYTYILPMLRRSSNRQEWCNCTCWAETRTYSIDRVVHSEASSTQGGSAYRSCCYCSNDRREGRKGDATPQAETTARSKVPRLNSTLETESGRNQRTLAMTSNTYLVYLVLICQSWMETSVLLVRTNRSNITKRWSKWPQRGTFFIETSYRTQKENSRRICTSSYPEHTRSRTANESWQLQGQALTGKKDAWAGFRSHMTRMAK